MPSIRVGNVEAPIEVKACSTFYIQIFSETSCTANRHLHINIANNVVIHVKYERELFYVHKNHQTLDYAQKNNSFVKPKKTPHNACN